MRKNSILGTTTMDVFRKQKHVLKVIAYERLSTSIRNMAKVGVTM
jgi:hypothetical protein